MTGILKAGGVSLGYLRIQSPDEDGCNVFLSLRLSDLTPLQFNTVSLRSLVQEQR